MTTLDGKLVQDAARELLGLSLDDDQSRNLSGALAGLKKMVDVLEQVPLPYTQEPFASPRSADKWLEDWPSK